MKGTLLLYVTKPPLKWISLAVMQMRVEVWIITRTVLGLFTGNCMAMCDIPQMCIDNTCTRNENGPSVESSLESMPESKGDVRG